MCRSPRPGDDQRGDFGSRAYSTSSPSMPPMSCVPSEVLVIGTPVEEVSLNFVLSPCSETMP